MAKRYFFIGNETVGDYVGRMLAEDGWSAADDIAAAQLVCTYFTYASALEDAYFGDEGVVKSASKDALVIDLSPSTPALVADISAVATVNNLVFVEAPLVVIDPVVSDAFSGADNIACFAAGEDGRVETADSVLGLLASRVEHLPSPAAAQLAKAAETVRVAAQVVAAIESDALVRAAGRSSFAGIAPAVPSVCESGIAASFDSALAEGRFAGSFTVEMFMGEVVAAMTAADDAEAILPQLESIMHLLEILAVIGGADLSPAALALVYREESEGAAAGLDWSRAEGLFAAQHEAEYDAFDDYDEGFGLGGYSVN